MTGALPAIRRGQVRQFVLPPSRGRTVAPAPAPPVRIDLAVARVRPVAR